MNMAPSQNRFIDSFRLLGDRAGSIFWCACFMFIASCGGIPDQDACIELNAAENDGRYFTVDTTKAYDTTASTIRCIIKYKNGSPAANWPVSLFADSFVKKEYSLRNGITTPLWVNDGRYSITIGNSSEYPCIIIRNLSVPGGRGCDLNVTLPTNE